MFCPHCGNNVADNTKFCPYCGATMEQQAPAAAPQQPPVGGPASYAPQQNSVPNYGAPQQTPYVPNYAAAQKAAKPNYMNPIALIAAAVTLIAMFLPFLTVSGFGYSWSFFDFMNIGYMDTGNPLIWLFLLMVAAVVILQLVKAPQVPSIVLAALSLVFLLIVIGGVANALANELGAYSSVVSYSLGLWLMLVGLIVIIASGPIYKAIFKK